MTTKIAAKKSLGQNFLVNPGVADRIVAAAALAPDDTVLEVGPGTGVLTARLAQILPKGRVVAVEKDRRLIEPLREKFKDQENVQIIEENILEFDPTQYGLEPGQWKFVANIPYYLTSHLLRKVLGQWPSPQSAVLMVQREVAERMTARPPDMNLLALSVQAYASVSVVMRVSRGSFRPSPNVDSAVVLLQPLLDADRVENERLLEVAKRAFAHKRKQLGSTFSGEALKNAGIAPKTRPQELSVADWRRLTTELH